MKRSTNLIGANFSPEVVNQVWEKGTPVANQSPSTMRRDSCGALMLRNKYGATDSEYGWEIDHVVPRSKGGTDLLGNLQPLQWENNRSKGDAIGAWTCAKR